MMYFTEYYVFDGAESKLFSSYVVADNEIIAKALLNFRGKRERIIGVGSDENKTVKNTAELFAANDILECLHTLCFVGEVLVSSGVIDHGYLLGDTGLIHDVLHLQLYPGIASLSDHYNEVYQKLKKFDQLKTDIGY